MFLASLRSSVALSALFFFLDLTFMLLMIGEFKEEVKVTKKRQPVAKLDEGRYVTSFSLNSC